MTLTAGGPAQLTITAEIIRPGTRTYAHPGHVTCETETIAVLG